MSKTIEERVAEIRASMAWPQTATAAGAEGDELVQLSIRVPARLRSQAHEAARRAGAESTQAWLAEVIADAVADQLAPHALVVREITDGLRARILEQLDAGAYEAAADIDDPLLR